ncbi:MAG: hypothetical protein N2Z79_05325 [Candidatus Omnitrophica bacterium]|nr:hypothetical protein [Candidatus Omnitrophota bacterium]
MNKKDVYEHLAKIYLDASSKHKKKQIRKDLLYKNLIFISALILVVGAGYIYFVPRLRNQGRISLVLTHEKIKINFHSAQAKTEAFVLNLNNLDLSRFKSLAFSARKLEPKDIISLRVEFRSIFNEIAFIYLKDIPEKWQSYNIKLSEFRGITNWSKIKELSFVIEEWNVRNEKSVVYLDNIRFEN